MQFREVTWAQQLTFQRLLHGAGAEVTERSLPNYPGAALREIIKQSGHPHNLEPLLLTLRRPTNKQTRQRFAEAAGELVLIQKVTSIEPIATDFKVFAAGQVTDSADGLLYPTKDTTTTYDTWLRVEMLDILRLMIEEDLVKSLVPDMQCKLLADMLQLVADDKQHELVRLYSFCVAFAGLKRFHAVRPAAIKAGFARTAADYLSSIVSCDSHPATSSILLDPFERLKALTTSIEALYLLAITTQQGDYTLPAAGATSKAAGNSSIDTLLQQRHVCTEQLQALAAGPLLVQAVQQCWQLLQDRNSFQYTPPTPATANGSANANGSAAADDNAAEEDETEAQKQLRAAAEEAAAAANMTFEENWQCFLKAVYDTDFVPSYALAAVQLGCALLQVLGHQGAADASLPDSVLQDMAAYDREPIAANTGKLLLTVSTAATADSSNSSSSTAIMGLSEHEDVELRSLAKLCCACGKHESRDTKLLRCSACGVAYYCSSACQKADWKAGHKAACKQLAEACAKFKAV